MTTKVVTIPLFQAGVLVSGQNPILHPYGDSSVSVSHSNEYSGLYEFVIDVQSQPDMIAQEYTMRNLGVIVNGLERLYYGPWMWKIRGVSPGSYPYQVAFIDLTDEDSDALPSRIDKAFAIPQSIEDRSIFSTGVSDENVDGVYDTLTVGRISGGVVSAPDLDILIFGG